MTNSTKFRKSDIDSVTAKPDYKILISGFLLSNGIIFILSVLSIISKEIFLHQFLPTVSQNLEIKNLFYEIPCSDNYKTDRIKWKGCAPIKCGRGISDIIIQKHEAVALLDLANRGFNFGTSDGGASILDLHSGALSKGSVFVNMYSLVNNKSEILSPDVVTIYKSVKKRIKNKIIQSFQLNTTNLFLTNPTFFSQINSKPARTIHDEYWHKHVDRETYGSFHFTSLLYLTTYGTNFTGGRFLFVDGNSTQLIIEPRVGRVSFFTSGSENEHFVEKVSSGVRFALTIAFTCDPKLSITDPEI